MKIGSISLAFLLALSAGGTAFGKWEGSTGAEFSRLWASPASSALRLGMYISGSLREKIYASHGVKYPPSSQASFGAVPDLHKMLEEKFSKRPFSCVVLVSPAGEVLDSYLLSSSGDSAIDKKTVQLLKESGPFRHGELKDKQGPPTPYKVNFPELMVLPLQETLLNNQSDN